MSPAVPAVDTRGMRCPWPLVRLARALRGAGAVRFLVDDPQAIADLPTLAREQGWSVTPDPVEGAFSVSCVAPIREQSPSFRNGA